jgi:hypothetical protein
MKKSKCYRLAQMAVLGEETLLPSEKLEVLRVLMEQETVQKLVEKGQEEKEKESEVDPY